MEAVVSSGGVTQEVEDPEALLNVWLGELDNLTLGLDKVTPSVETQKQSSNDGRPLSSDLNVPRIDSLRYSMANMEDTQDVDLDAILGELCALENEYEEAIRTTNVATRKSGDMSSREVNSPNNNSRLSQLSTGRTHSPDNDSAYSDSLSLLSSESSTSTRPDLHHPQSEAQNTIVHNAPTSKAEKIRLAMQKIKEASVKKIFVKVFNDDGSVKSLLVDETMTCGYITRVLAEKNHRPYDPRCALVEHLTELNMERVYEENELLVNELMRWTYSSKNRLHFSWDRPEKTLLFDAPWLFVGPADPRRDREPAHHHSPSPQNIAILEEFFAGSGVPSVEGPLYIKSDSSRKGWKRYHCILRSSGLYYWPKDKSKCSSKDLVCLATFDSNMVYYGVGWKKRYKAPTDHCFALKHPALQEQPKSSKYIKYLCADDPTSLHRWVTAVRLVKYGRQLLTDYKSSLEECRHVDLVSQRPPSSSSSSSSSGCDVGFESDFPCGTIKRKPAKIPLTSTTRQLKSAAIGEEECYMDEDLPPPPPELMVDDDEELPPTKTSSLSSASASAAAAAAGGGGSSSSRNSLFLGTRSNPRFLEDLHRVVEKKWQVAEKCRLEVGTSPHQVLGFRDYDKCLGVSQWVEEHYGGSIGSSHSSGSLGSRNRGPAPPPPPRAPTTVLSRR